MSASMFVCVLVDTKTSSLQLSETGQFMSSAYYVPVRNRKILASTTSRTRAYIREPRKADVSSFLALLKLDFNPGDFSLKRLLPQRNLDD